MGDYTAGNWFTDIGTVQDDDPNGMPHGAMLHDPINNICVTMLRMQVCNNCLRC